MQAKKHWSAKVLSWVVAMMGRIHSDLFAQQKYLLDGVDLHVKLNQYSHLIGAEGATFNVQLHNVPLFVRKVKISPVVKLAHIKVPQITPARFSIHHLELKTYSIPPHGNVNRYCEQQM